MIFEVWHAKNPTFRSYPKEGSTECAPCFPDDYEKVADVTTAYPEMDEKLLGLELVFGLTQNKDASWAENKDVVWSKSDRLRSTSVGDVIVMPNGKRMYCEPVGWKII